MLHALGLVLYAWGYYREEQVNTQMVGNYESLHTILTGVGAGPSESTESPGKSLTSILNWVTVMGRLSII